MSYIDDSACTQFMKGCTWAIHELFWTLFVDQNPPAHRRWIFCLQNQQLRFVWTKFERAKQRQAAAVHPGLYFCNGAGTQDVATDFFCHLVATVTLCWKQGAIRRNTLISQRRLWHESRQIRSLLFFPFKSSLLWATALWQFSDRENSSEQKIHHKRFSATKASPNRTLK